jgi:hypothetical protein
VSITYQAVSTLPKKWSVQCATLSLSMKSVQPPNRPPNCTQKATMEMASAACTERCAALTADAFALAGSPAATLEYCPGRVWRA